MKEEEEEKDERDIRSKISKLCENTLCVCVFICGGKQYFYYKICVLLNGGKVRQSFTLFFFFLLFLC